MRFVLFCVFLISFSAAPELMAQGRGSGGKGRADKASQNSMNSDNEDRPRATRNRRGRGGGAQGGRKAMAACEGKALNERCQYERRGDLVEGECLQNSNDLDQLVCKSMDADQEGPKSGRNPRGSRGEKMDRTKEKPTRRSFQKAIQGSDESED